LLPTNTADINDHLVREFNRRVFNLGLNSLLIVPFDGGFRYLGGDIVDPASVALYFYDASSESSVTVANPEGSPLLVASWASTAGENDIGRTLAQAVSLNQPQYLGSNRVNFADTSDVLTFDTAVAQAGWQVVGTSRGTFAYRINASSQSNIRLFGNQGFLNLTGDLYGVIYLPADAAPSMVEAARQMLIQRGATSEVVGTNVDSWWRARPDIVEFGFRDFSAVTSFNNTWQSCTSLTSFPLINTSSGTSFNTTWSGCASLTSFPLIDTSSGTSFNTTWFNCNSLISFPLIDTSSGTSFNSTWRNCASLTSFPLIDASSGTNFNLAWSGCTSLTSFPLINTSSGTSFNSTWLNCTSLTSFPAGFFDSWTGTPIANCFLNTWAGNTSLTATSVENIFNSLDASGRSAPATGTEITVTYSTATGTPNITAAVANLKSRGWTPRLNDTLL
jgi:hypothetical protein